MKSIGHALAEAIKNLPKKSKIEVFCAGAMLGLIASWIYLLCGGPVGWFVPLWADIVFLPGFFVGTYCYNLYRNMPLAMLFGSLSVGLFYGIALVVILFLWNLLAHRKKYVIVVLCIITMVTGTLYLKRFFTSPSDICHSIRQEYTLSITSDPSGAKVYLLDNYRDQPDSIGITPIEFKGFYSIDRDGSGWAVSGRWINLKSTEEGILILLNCVIAKNGYVCQELVPVIGTIPKNIARPDQMPSDLRYNATLIPNESPYVNTIGQAILVNGSFFDVNPPSLKMKEGVYIIDIKSAK